MIMTKVYVKNKKMITYLPFDKVFQYYKTLKSNFKTSRAKKSQLFFTNYRIIKNKKRCIFSRCSNVTRRHRFCTTERSTEIECSFHGKILVWWDIKGFNLCKDLSGWHCSLTGCTMSIFSKF